MKAQHSEDYFMKYDSDLLKKYARTADFEGSLRLRISDLSSLSEEMKSKALPVLQTRAAMIIVEESEKDLKCTMRMIKELKAGKASLGYTTKVQEVCTMHDIVEGFEYSCFKLAQFKRKYLPNKAQTEVGA